MFSCNNEEQKESDTKIVKTNLNVLPAPFKKHHKIEIGLEIIFDIYSWGRGADSSSSVLVLRSDSLKNEFSVASTDNLDGRLQVFNTDMDNDSNPEIVIYYTKNDAYETAKVICYEFVGKEVKKINFPDLTDKTQKIYKGLDKFYTKEGFLFREFNIYENSESNKPTSKKSLKYSLKQNQFDIEELKE